jgi:pyruvate dehydrogenase E2 component (dihydrolipoamide acetyltransferase)
MADFTMPSLGADMDAGTILEWRVAPGDQVTRGDIVAVVQTDKADIEVESFHDGVVDELLVPEGQRVAVGTPLARLTEPVAEAATAPTAAKAPAGAGRAGMPSPTPGRPPAEAPQPPGAPAPPRPVRPSPEPVPQVTSPLIRRLAEHHGIDLASIEGSGPGGTITRDDIERAVDARRAVRRPVAPAAAPAPKPAPVAPNGQRKLLPTVQRGAPGPPLTSPRARRLAAEAGVDLTSIPGSGPRGSITGDDVVRHAAAPPATAPPATAEDRLAAQRRAIGALMARSKAEIPHYYLSTDVDLAATQAFLEDRNRDRPPQTRLLPAAVLLKAVLRAATEVPGFNGHWHPRDGFVAHDDVQLGVAVTLREGGLIAPTLPDAGERDLDDLMVALRDLVARARRGRLRGAEMSDATLTVTNLGDRGAAVVYGVIVPPQVALVGAGRIEQRPRVITGPRGGTRIEARPVVTLTLSADHRVTTGHEGSRFLDTIANLLQTPEEL